MKIGMTLCLLLAPIFGAQASAHTGNLDQVSLPTNTWFYCYEPIHVWQQQVRVGLAGRLDAFELILTGPAGAGVDLRLRVGDAWNVGPVVWSTHYTKTTGSNEVAHFNVFDQRLIFSAGDTFVIEAQGNDTGAELRGSYVNPLDGPSQYPEPLSLSGPGCYENCGYSVAFRTWMVEDLSTNYCAATNNSTGAPASMSVTGSFSVAANDLVLHATSVPPGQLGRFVYAGARNAVSFGNGLLCVASGGAGLVRMPIGMADAAGVLTTPLNNMVWGAPATQITAGSTWHFQAWFRDPPAGGAGFNLSDGLEVIFIP